MLLEFRDQALGIEFLMLHVPTIRIEDTWRLDELRTEEDFLS